MGFAAIESTHALALDLLGQGILIAGMECFQLTALLASVIPWRRF